MYSSQSGQSSLSGSLLKKSTRCRTRESHHRGLTPLYCTISCWLPPWITTCFVTKSRLKLAAPFIRLQQALQQNCEDQTPTIFTFPVNAVTCWTVIVQNANGCRHNTSGVRNDGNNNCLDLFTWVLQRRAWQCQDCTRDLRGGLVQKCVGAACDCKRCSLVWLRLLQLLHSFWLTVSIVGDFQQRWGWWKNHHEESGINLFFAKKLIHTNGVVK